MSDDAMSEFVETVHFGAVGKPLPPITGEDDDPDDEELEQTPEYVVRILGFDPKELNDSK